MCPQKPGGFSAVARQSGSGSAPPSSAATYISFRKFPIYGSQTLKCNAKDPSSQCLKFLAPKTIPLMVFGGPDSLNVGYLDPLGKVSTPNHTSTAASIEPYIPYVWVRWMLRAQEEHWDLSRGNAQVSHEPWSYLPGQFPKPNDPLYSLYGSPL